MRRRERWQSRFTHAVTCRSFPTLNHGTPPFLLSPTVLRIQYASTPHTAQSPYLTSPTQLSLSHQLCPQHQRSQSGPTTPHLTYRVLEYYFTLQQISKHGREHRHRLHNPPASTLQRSRSPRFCARISAHASRRRCERETPKQQQAVLAVPKAQSPDRALPRASRPLPPTPRTRLVARHRPSPRSAARVHRARHRAAGAFNYRPTGR
jgi:hypothetical protein